MAYDGLGRPPKYHDECNPRAGRAARRAKEKLKQLRDEVVKERAERVDSELTGGAADIPSGWHPRLLAVALGLESDASRAAALVGIDVESPAELEALVSEAKRHQDLTQRKPGTVGALLATAISTGAIRLAAQMQTIPPAQLPTALRALAQSLELVQGSTQPAYSQIVLSIKAPDGSSWVSTGEAA